MTERLIHNSTHGVNGEPDVDQLERVELSGSAIGQQARRSDSKHDSELPCTDS